MSGWACDWCGGAEGRGCSDDCGCPGCVSDGVEYPSERDVAAMRSIDEARIPEYPPPVTAPTRGGADEIREQVARWLCEQRNGAGGWDHEPGRRYWLEDADALLSGPLAPLLALHQRVEDAVRHIGKEARISSFPLSAGYQDSAKILRRALDGTP